MSALSAFSCPLSHRILTLAAQLMIPACPADGRALSAAVDRVIVE
jgi:hypothetical protein